jgi:hypothetical protein
MISPKSEKTGDGSRLIYELFKNNDADKMMYATAFLFIWGLGGPEITPNRWHSKYLGPASLGELAGVSSVIHQASDYYLLVCSCPIQGSCKVVASTSIARRCF